jgi:hypothetical protein
MTAQSLLWIMLAAGSLSGCGSRSPQVAETKPAATTSVVPQVAPISPRDSDRARDEDRLLREVERTIASPVPGPMLPLLELESGGPAERADR